MEKKQGRNGIAVLEALESLGDRVRSIVDRRSRKDWQIGVQPYRTFGTSEVLHVAGRVLRDASLAETSIHDSAWKNLKASLHRFESDEISGAELQVAYHGRAEKLISDDEGYVNGVIQFSEPLHPGWHSLRMTLEKIPFGLATTGEVDTECLIPSLNAQFGIISDIDDTVLHTQVNSRLRMILWSLFGNAYSRLPLPGVSRLYRLLAASDNENDVNPVFYISSSPWNLYPVLCEFLEAVDLPKGPLMLRDMGIGKGASLGSDHRHKAHNIVSVLEAYPRLRFILMGDSGEEDASIYSKIIRTFPGRILCAYIRDTGHGNREVLDQAISGARQAGSELILAPTSKEMEEHARANGWI